MFIWFLKGSGLAGQRFQQKEGRINILQCCPKPLLPTALSKGEFPLLPLAVVTQDYYFCFPEG